MTPTPGKARNTVRGQSAMKSCVGEVERGLEDDDRQQDVEDEVRVEGGVPDAGDVQQQTDQDEADGGRQLDLGRKHDREGGEGQDEDQEGVRLDQRADHEHGASVWNDADEASPAACLRTARWSAHTLLSLERPYDALAGARICCSVYFGARAAEAAGRWAGRPLLPTDRVARQ